MPDLPPTSWRRGSAISSGVAARLAADSGEPEGDRRSADADAPPGDHRHLEFPNLGTWNNALLVQETDPLVHERLAALEETPCPESG
jgi:hypothetical protein